MFMTPFITNSMFTHNNFIFHFSGNFIESELKPHVTSEQTIDVTNNHITSVILYVLHMSQPFTIDSYCPKIVPTCCIMYVICAR